MQSLVYVAVLLPALASAWTGILIPGENGEYPGQVYSPGVVQMTGQNHHNFGLNGTDIENVAVASCGYLVYITGGLVRSSKKTTNKILVYDANVDRTWTDSMTLVQARASHFAVCMKGMGRHGHRLLVCGGYKDAPLSRISDCEICDTHEGKCKKVSSMPAGATNQRAVEAFGKVYVAGGYCDLGHDVFWSYDPVTDKWNTKLPKMPAKRAEFGFTHIHGKFLACGGWKDAKSNGKGLDSCDMYCPFANVWYPVAKMHRERMRLGMVELNGKIYAIGGIHDDKATNMIEEYNYFTDKWTEHETTLMSPQMFAMTSVPAYTCY